MLTPVLLLAVLTVVALTGEHPPAATVEPIQANSGIVFTTLNEVTSRESSTPPTTTDSSTSSGGNLLSATATEATMSQSSAPLEDTDEPWFPTLANGHLGFTVLEDAVYMNGLYNGRSGLSHRARIANLANLRLNDGNRQPTTESRMDFASGTFFVDYRGPNNSYRVTQAIYAHQLYNRAIVNQFRIERLAGDGEIRIGITQASTSPTSEDIVFSPTKSTIFSGHDAERPSSLGSSGTGSEYSTATGRSYQVHQTCGTTLELEDPAQQRQQPRHVCVLWNHVPEELTLERSERTVSYKFIMTADESASRARRELEQVLLISDDDELLRLHADIWASFWSRFDIQLEGNPELEQTVRASVFYLITNFPLQGDSNEVETYQFGGLSPTGLGRGGSYLDDYEGHSFWDTEIWMFPVVNLIDSDLSRMALDYRSRMMDAARDYARASGFRGTRFPWESAATGVETTQPDYVSSVAYFQHHITADISFALRQYLATTQNIDWLRARGCPLAQEIAEFWASRLTLDPVTGLYDIKEVMGPDEDHKNVTNNAYTNVIAGYALYFGDLTKCLCADGNKSNPSPPVPKSSLGDKGSPAETIAAGNWSALASRIKLLYDAENDYHPQFEGYRLGTVIKQADTVLLGYPLQYQSMVTATTRSNDLRFYEAVTRSTGPAMTWSIHAINHLDLGETAEAEAMFQQSYESYVKGPFRVWGEYTHSRYGARNFITGAGGFLQAVIYGFGGVRVFLDRLMIRNTRLPTGVTTFRIKGLEYLGTRLTLTATNAITTLTAERIAQNLIVQLGNDTSMVMRQQEIYDITDKEVTIRAVDNIFQNCPVPNEVLSTVQWKQQ